LYPRTGPAQHRNTDGPHHTQPCLSPHELTNPPSPPPRWQCENHNQTGRLKTKKGRQATRLGSEKLISKSSVTYCPTRCNKLTRMVSHVYTTKGVCGRTSKSNLTKFTHHTVQTHKQLSGTDDEEHTLCSTRLLLAIGFGQSAVKSLVPSTREAYPLLE